MPSSKAVQALLDGIMMGTNRCAEKEWDQSVIIDREEDDIKDMILRSKSSKTYNPHACYQLGQGSKRGPRAGSCNCLVKNGLSEVEQLGQMSGQTEVTNGTHERNPKWQSGPQDCAQTDSVRRSPISETPSQQHTRCHQVICHAPGTLQESDGQLP